MSFHKMMKSCLIVCLLVLWMGTVSVEALPDLIITNLTTQTLVTPDTWFSFPNLRRVGKADGPLPAAFTNIQQAWAAPGTYHGMAQARYATDTSIVSGWSSALTVTISPDCSYSLSSAGNTLGSGAGTGSVNVTAGAGCAWTASTNSGSWDWVGISSGASGTGNGTVNYFVLANNTGSPRTGTLTIAGQTFTITQQTGGCSYSLSSAGNTLGSGAGTGSVNVTAGAGCAWTASTNSGSWDWVGISSGASGTGNGTVNYFVLANNTGSTRTGTITIAGQTFTITQQTGGCSYSLSSAGNTLGSGAGTGSVNVTAGAGCAWTASTNSGSWDWVGISSGASGTGNGTVNYFVLANNTGSTRTGTITIAGQTFTITQQTGGCSYSLSSAGNTLGSGAGTGSVNVTAGAGCAWTASTNSGSWDWIGISSGASGTGNGTVNYFVLANNTGSTRTGTITIAGQIFTVTQLATGNKVAFVTSVSGTGNLGSWPDAGGKTGADAGDAICQARAAAGGLSNPSQFRAWLSDQSNDAYCRIHNLTGKKSSNCGMASLPVAAGPWVRTDGFPFGESIDQLLDPDNKVYTPVRYDEFGNQVPSGTLYFADTQADGTLPSPPSDFALACSNWSSASESMSLAGGSPEMTSYAWSWYAWEWCNGPYSLLCLQTGAGPSLPSFVSSGKKAFLTSVRGTGNLGSWADAGGNTGIAAGDAICRARATAAGLANATHFKAWLSDSTTNAKDRISGNGPWVRLDGVLIASSKADLLDGSLFTSINVTETMNYIGSWDNVWTGTGTDGNKTTDHCSNWTSSSSGSNGRTGSGNHAGQGWTYAWSQPCDGDYRSLYCIED